MPSSTTLAHTIDPQVDVALHRIAMAPTLMLPVSVLYDVEVMSEVAYNVDHFMLEKGLIRIVEGGRVLTGKGLEISNFGGWVSYQQHLKRERPVRTEDSRPSFQNQIEVHALKREIERYKAELKFKSEKEQSTSTLLKNVIDEKKNGRTMLLLTGAVVGFVTASLMWLLIFG
jgi:hypothetical protein